MNSHRNRSEDEAEHGGQGRWGGLCYDEGRVRETEGEGSVEKTFVAELQVRELSHCYTVGYCVCQCIYIYLLDLSQPCLTLL